MDAARDHEWRHAAPAAGGVMAGTTSWNPCPRCSTAASMIFHAEWDAEAQRSYPVPCPESDPTPRAPGGTREEDTEGPWPTLCGLVYADWKCGLDAGHEGRHTDASVVIGRLRHRAEAAERERDALRDDHPHSAVLYLRAVNAESRLATLAADRDRMAAERDEAREQCALLARALETHIEDATDADERADRMADALRELCDAADAVLGTWPERLVTAQEAARAALSPAPTTETEPNA